MEFGDRASGLSGRHLSNSIEAVAETGAREQTVLKNKSNRSLTLLRECVELVAITLALLVGIRYFLAEARFIPSKSMEPTLQIGDRLLVEKISGHLHRSMRRGEIIVFYPPPGEMGGKDLSNSPLMLLGRLTGLPGLPYEPAFIKRVIGLPGDKIRIQKNIGVYVNDQLLDEWPYAKEKPDYNLDVLGDIGIRNFQGMDLRPFKAAGKQNEPIVVPPGHFFVMGDNRNNSADSHVWGFLDENRVIGRACLLFFRQFTSPNYEEGPQ